MKDQDQQMYAYTSWLTRYGGAAKDMTLRDHFAGLAMQVFLANDETDIDDDAKDAYMVADALLRAREK